VDTYFSMDRYIERVLGVYRTAIELSRHKRERLLAVEQEG
jgi:hypothetical protein